MKGIILSGGLGTRLYPLTLSVSKQLLPVYDKPMIYYSLSTLMLADIKDILLITSSDQIKNYKNLFGNGSSLGIKISYKVQNQPRGLVDALNLGSNFIGKDDFCLILGDNIFYGDSFSSLLKEAKTIVKKKRKSVLFTFPVQNPKDYGIAKFNNNKLISIIEKPSIPPSSDAVVGLYFYSNSVLKLSKKVLPSSRGELEITDLNNKLIKKNKIYVKKMGRGYTWFDAGTPESLNFVSDFIKTLQNRTGHKIGCIEEIAIAKKWINREKIIKGIKKYKNSEYTQYLQKISK